MGKGEEGLLDELSLGRMAIKSCGFYSEPQNSTVGRDSKAY